MICEPETAPVDVLLVKAKQAGAEEVKEPIYGGYENSRGDVSLFAEKLVYRVNFKNKTVRQHPSLNPEAQALYEAAGAGEAFQYCNVNFRRLSNDQIVEICGSGAFRATPRV
jgi:hypothetical protein